MNPETLRLRLQAYERHALLAERISLQNLLSLTPNAGLSSRQMQSSLIDAIKQEYDYNISQQVYVSSEVWRAINNLKEQNIYIINQLATTLPQQASAGFWHRQLQSGQWQLSFSAAELPAQPGTLTAWAFDADSGKAYRLNGSFEIPESNQPAKNHDPLKSQE